MKGKTAILDLYGDENATLCQAWDVIDGELQPEELGVDVGSDPIAMALINWELDENDEDAEEAEKQCVRSVLGQLAKKGYTAVVFWESSELQPEWMPSMLRNFKL